MLEFSCNLVVIALNKVDCPAGQPLPISGHLFRSPHAKVAKEIENIIRLNARIHSAEDSSVHLLRICKWTIAVPNDVEVSEVKVGREPNVMHNLILDVCDLNFHNICAC